jgi:hypothetical protein
VISFSSPEENEHFQISYSVFCRLCPFWTVAPTEKDRETCLCKICENGRYLAVCLKNYNVLDTNNLSELCKRVVCSTLNKDCMYGTCKQCCNKKLVSKTVEETKQVTDYFPDVNLETSSLCRNLKTCVRKRVLREPLLFLAFFLKQQPIVLNSLTLSLYLRSN